jgi:Rod binding domain-containing protein
MSIPITRVGQLPQAFATTATNGAAATGAGTTAPISAPTAGTAANATGTGSTATGSGATATAHAAKDAKTAKLEKAAGEFEQIFVKQLLKEAKVGGAEKEGGGYGDMAVDALASGVQKGGGLGLAKQIEAALAAHHQTPSTSGATMNPASPHVSTFPLQPATRAAKR